MAKILHRPNQHVCHTELAELGDEPVGTIAQCSCGKKHIRKEDPRDGRYWQEHMEWPAAAI